MRTSNYIHYVTLPETNHFFIAHGYTGAVDRVAPEVVRYLLERRDSQLGTHVKDEVIALESLAGERGQGAVKQETIDSLVERGYLTDKTVEEEREYVKHLTHRFHAVALMNQRPGFLLIPTYECNLRCPYCFETDTRIDLHKQGALLDVMTPQMADAAFQTMDILIARHLNSSDSLPEARKQHRIMLYGGEPLQRMTRSIVEYIVGKGRGLGFRFSAITNGVDLHEFGELLGPDGISWMQITLDGPEEIHNVNRIGPAHRNTFHGIMDNMVFAVSHGATVSVRLHTDWKSVNRTPEIMAELEKRGLLANSLFSIYAVPRHAWHVGQDFPMYPNMAQHQLAEKMAGTAGIAHSGSRKRVSVADERITEKLRAYIRGGMAALSRTVEYCSANTGGMHIMDGFGAIYSCWDTVGRKNECVGTYSLAGPVFNERSDDWAQRCPGDIPECSNCKYVMFHFGGCAALPVSIGRGLLSPACNAFADMFVHTARKYFASDKYKDIIEPLAPPADAPMDLATVAD